MVRGVAVQCRPNITMSCHSPPMAVPAAAGLRWYSHSSHWAKNSESPADTGPMTRNVAGTVTKSVASGSVKLRMVSGRRGASSLASRLANHTANSTGSTLVV